MGELKTNYVTPELCELRHKPMDSEVEEVKGTIERIIDPVSGYIAAAKNDLDKKIEKVDSKLNGLIMFLSTTSVGIVIAVLTELYRKYGK